MRLYLVTALLDYSNALLAGQKYTVYSALLVDLVFFLKACANANRVLKFSMCQRQVTIFKTLMEQLVLAVVNLANQQCSSMILTETL